MNQRGFTLVELAFVILVIGALTAGVLVGGKHLVRQADKKAFAAKVQSLVAATSEFRDRYRMYPGDFIVNETEPEIPRLSKRCLSVGRGNGNGLIDANESTCAREQLLGAGVLEVAAFEFKFPQVSLSFLSVQTAGVPVGTLKANVRNVVVFQNLPCYLTQAVPSGVVITGVCSVDDEDVEVQFAVAAQ